MPTDTVTALIFTVVVCQILFYGANVFKFGAEDATVDVLLKFSLLCLIPIPFAMFILMGILFWTGTVSAYD